MTFMEVTAFLMDGFLISLLIFAVTLLCSVPLGLPIAFCSMSRFKPLQAVSKIFVWIVRGVPLMLQIFIIYYVPGLLFDTPIFSYIDRHFFLNYQIQDAGRVIAVLVAFSINYACYFSEIYRGGIESISKGQYEAGYVLGLTKKQIFRKIVLKQVVQRIVPPMSNEIITLAPKLLKQGTPDEIQRKALTLLEQVGLSQKAGNYPHQLSGGQQQRLAIARALALNPEILCFDEPTSALDPELTGEVLRVIRSLKDQNNTMIVVTHEMGFAKSVADVVIYMAEGVIEEIGTPEQIFENPTSPKTRAFIQGTLETF